MIGDVPKGAPLKCRLGRHTGQERGGTMCFYCPACGGTYWQRGDYSAVEQIADAMIQNGESERALALAQRAVAEGGRPKRWWKRP